MLNEPPPPDFASDRPIEYIHQDKLGRRRFARKTAEAIAKRHKRESFVVALQGAWGCGKSSIKNMVLEALKELPSSTIVVDFAPWQLRDADTLFSVFFDEIALAIGQSGDQNADQKERLTSYGKHLTLGGSTIKALGTLGGIVGVPGAKIVEILGEGMGNSAKVALEGADAIGEKSLKQLKDELKESLLGLEQSVLVVIDDIDRLDVDEMLLIFQLIKANADFPNFTYLVLLHREVVESALAKRVGEQGRDYLEKIIQLPIDVPPISDSQRRQLLIEGLVDMCKSWDLPLSSEQTRELDLLWTNGLSGMLQQPRDVRRLLNALEFSGALMQGDAGWEINLADFTALETIRIQEPKVYGRLPTLKALLTGHRRSTTKEIIQRFRISTNSGADENEEEQPGRIEMAELVALLTPARHDAARKMLAFAFPKANWAFITPEEARVRLTQPNIGSGIRVGESRYFDRYFALSIPSDQISEAEIADGVALSGDRERFTTYLKEFQDRQLLWLLIVELKDRAKTIPLENAVSLLSTLLDFGEDIPEEIGIGGDYMEHALGWLFEEVLKQREEVSQRGQLFKEALENSKALRLPVRWTWDEEMSNRGQRFSSRTNSWGTEAQLTEIRDMVTARIETYASENQLASHPQVQMIIRFWSETQQEDMTRWLNQTIGDEHGLRFFLSKFCNKSYMNGSPLTLHDITFEPDVLEWITDLNLVKDRVKELDKAEWDEIEKFTAEKFVISAESILSRRTQSLLNASADVESE